MTSARQSINETYMDRETTLKLLTKKAIVTFMTKKFKVKDKIKARINSSSSPTRSGEPQLKK